LKNEENENEVNKENENENEVNEENKYKSLDKYK